MNNENAPLFYVCRVVLDTVAHYCLWYSDDVDGILASDGRILVWPSEAATRSYAMQKDLTIASTRLSEFDLDYPERLVYDKSLFLAKDCLDLWNFLSDIEATIGNADFHIKSRSADEIHARLSAHTLADILQVSESSFSGADIDCISDVLVEGRKMFRQCWVKAEK